MSSKAKNDCCKLIQQVAILQDPQCIGCGQPSQLGHHLFKRSNTSTAFLPEAVRGLCHQCHMAWAHGKPREFKAYMVSIMGNHYHELARLSRMVVKNTDYAAVRQELRGILESLGKKAVNF